MDNKELMEINEKLDKLLKAVALMGTRDLSIKEQIVHLHRCGLRPTEIAGLIGTTQNVVNVRLSEMRKERGLKK